MWSTERTVLCSMFQDSDSSLSEDTGLGSEDSSSCECKLH